MIDNVTRIDEPRPPLLQSAGFLFTQFILIIAPYCVAKSNHTEFNTASTTHMKKCEADEMNDSRYLHSTYGRRRFPELQDR